ESKWSDETLIDCGFRRSSPDEHAFEVECRGLGRERRMPSIKFEITDRISRHLAAVRLMTYMVHPDDAKLRQAAEITSRTILADWYSVAFAKRPQTEQARVIHQIGAKLGADLPRALADPPS